MIIANICKVREVRDVIVDQYIDGKKGENKNKKEGAKTKRWL